MIITNVEKVKIILVTKLCFIIGLSIIFWLPGSSHSDKEVDALTPEKSAAMRGSTVGPGAGLVPPGGATPTIAVPEKKRKRKGYFIYNFMNNSYMIRVNIEEIM